MHRQQIRLARPSQRSVANGEESARTHSVIIHSRIRWRIWEPPCVTFVFVLPSSEQAQIAALAPIIEATLDLTGYGMAFAITAHLHSICDFIGHLQPGPTNKQVKINTVITVLKRNDVGNCRDGDVCASAMRRRGARGCPGLWVIALGLIANGSRHAQCSSCRLRHV